MSPVSPVFNTVATLSISLKNTLELEHPFYIIRCPCWDTERTKKFHFNPPNTRKVKILRSRFLPPENSPELVWYRFWWVCKPPCSIEPFLSFYNKITIRMWWKLFLKSNHVYTEINSFLIYSKKIGVKFLLECWSKDWIHKPKTVIFFLT